MRPDKNFSVMLKRIIHQIALKESFLFILCLLSLSVQLHFRTPIGWWILAIPWVGIMLSLLSFMNFLQRILFYVPTKDPLRHDFRRIELIGTLALYLFIAYGMVLLLNCALDQSTATTYKTVILDMSSTELDVGDFIPVTRVRVQSWDDPAKHETFFSNGREENQMWPQEPVLVKLHEGVLGIPWLSPLERDDETLMKRMLQISPTAAMPWKILTQFYISNKRWPEVVESARQYFKHYPDDIATAMTMSGVYLGMNKGREAIEILEPIAQRHESYELHMQLGWILGQEPSENDRKRGLEYVQNALKQNPNDWKGYYTEGFVLMWNGREREALASFERSLSLNPNFPQVQQEVARLRTKLHGT